LSSIKRINNEPVIQGGFNLIKKQLKLSAKIEKLEATIRRLVKDFPKRQEMQEELAKSYAGYKGELSLDYYFNLLPTNDYFFLHNLRLPNSNGNHFFQMDIVLLTPFYFLIIEVKNIAGTLTFDPVFDQLIWTTPEKEIALPDPVRQVKNQKYQLIEWLKLKRFPLLPVETIVVLTNPQTIIKINSIKKEYIDRIIRSTRFISKIEDFKRHYTKELISTKDINKISNLLIKQHTPAVPDFFERFNIQKSELLTGVFCENCSMFTMQYHWGEWICKRCSFTNKDGHLDALRDFALLYQPTITNRQLRDFLHLPNSDSAYYLLQSMSLQHTGGYKGRKYYLPPVELD